MRVRILSGNNVGQVVEMAQSEAESNIATGYAEAVLGEPEIAVVPPIVEASRHPARRRVTEESD